MLGGILDNELQLPEPHLPDQAIENTWNLCNYQQEWLQQGQL